MEEIIPEKLNDKFWLKKGRFASSAKKGVKTAPECALKIKTPTLQKLKKSDDCNKPGDEKDLIRNKKRKRKDSKESLAKVEPYFKDQGGG